MLLYRSQGWRGGRDHRGAVRRRTLVAGFCRIDGGRWTGWRGGALSEKKAADVTGRGSFGAELAQAACIVAFGKATALLITDKGVMVIDGRRHPEQGLQQDLKSGCIEEVFAARDFGDPLPGIIHHDRQVIGRADVAPGQDQIPMEALQSFGRGMVDAGMQGPGLGETPDPGKDRNGPLHVKSDCIAGLQVAHRTVAACPGIRPRRSDAFLRGGEGKRDVASAAPAGEGQAAGCKDGKCLPVWRGIIGLAQDRPIPGDAQPTKVLDDGGFIFGAASGPVGVFHPEQEAPSR